MSDLPDYRSLPKNDEHLEAFQATIDAQRAAQKAAMSPEQRRRVEIMESVSAQLEEAGVPFILFAAPTDDGSTGFYRFLRFHYDPVGAPDAAYRKRVKDALFLQLSPALAQFSTAYDDIHFASFFNADGSPAYHYDMSGGWTKPVKVILEGPDTEIS